MVNVNTSMLEHLFDIVKKVKKPIVKIFPDGRAIGTDEQFASLNIIVDHANSDQYALPFIFITKEITAFMKQDYYNNLTFDNFSFMIKSGIDIITLDNHIELNYKIDELYNRVMSQELTKPILYVEEYFNQSIPEMFSLKSSDGARMYSFGVDKKFLMSSFNSIHPSTKTDKVDLIIRDSDYYSYTAEFIIYKKKANYELHEILRFRKL